MKQAKTRSDMGCMCFRAEEPPKTPAKYKKKAIPTQMREDVWYVNFGIQFKGKCCCCDRPITHDLWECGHVVAERNGGATELDNLRPCCSRCNKSMGTQNMDEYALTCPKFNPKQTVIAPVRKNNKKKKTPIRRQKKGT